MKNWHTGSRVKDKSSGDRLSESKQDAMAPSYVRLDTQEFNFIREILSQSRASATSRSSNIEFNSLTCYTFRHICIICRRVGDS